MSLNKYLAGALLVSLLAGLAVGAVVLKPSSALTIVVCDVGQGDAILLRTTAGFDLLIDGGSPDALVMSCLGRHLPPWDRTLELVVATHPDADHIGGLVEVARRYDIGQFWHNGQAAETAVYRTLMAELTARQVELKAAAAGQTITNGSLVMTVLWPPASLATTTTNQASVVMRAVFGQASVLLTGDMDLSVEQQLLKQSWLLKSDLLKVSHHGSRSATSPSWLQAVRPSVALISVGHDNRYGHPHAEVVKRLLDAGLSLWRTDYSGDLVWRTAGRFWQKIKP